MAKISFTLINGTVQEFVKKARDKNLEIFVETLTDKTRYNVVAKKKDCDIVEYRGKCGILVNNTNILMSYAYKDFHI